MIDSIYWNAIVEANKWGAKGYQVVMAVMPERAMERNKIKLVVIKPMPSLASLPEWYDR